MKNILMTKVMMFLGIMYSFAQTRTPETVFPFYIEDANLHKDTIYFAVDSMANASAEWIDTALGEEDITNKPWDDTFEARFGDVKFYFAQRPRAMSKTRVTRGSCNKSSTFYYYRAINYIYVKTKSFPITIHWDTTLLSKQCMSWSYFQRKSYAFDLPQKKEHIYLRNLHGKFKMSKSYIDSTKQIFNDDYIDPAGDSIITLLFINAALEPSGNNISTIDLPETMLSIYPNPVSDKLSIDFSAMPFEKCTLSIIDMTGKRYQSIEIPYSSKHDIDVAALPSGMYILELISDRQKRICKKFVKLD